MNFSPLIGTAAPLPTPNINTDLVVPARYLKKPRAGGYQDYLFRDLRFDDDGQMRKDFILNDPRFEQATILVTGPNFGCGSSREGAVYALADYGIRCIIGESFGDIFTANCAKNGLLTVQLPVDAITALFATVQGDDTRVTVDLPAQTIGFDQQSVGFNIEPDRKTRLIMGTDEIDETQKYLGEISAFEARVATR